MKILDLDMDYFMDAIAQGIGESEIERLDDEYGDYVWEKERVISFLESNLGLSKEKKIKGRIVKGHNEALYFWKELIERKQLVTPFEVIHVDSHADLGLGYSSCKYILDELLYMDVKIRPRCNFYEDCFGHYVSEGIGDYLLFAIAYQWVSELTYCANPHGDKNDYILDILKNFHEEDIWDEPVKNIIQLARNSKMERPDFCEIQRLKELYFETAEKDPEVPFMIIPTVEGVKYNGDFDFLVLAQSPNYTPARADYIIDIVRDYIEEM